jgi:hypothetical protein
MASRTLPAVVALALPACNFQAPGLGPTGEPVSESSGADGTDTSTGGSTAVDESSGPAPDSSGDAADTSTGAPCGADCPPEADWTVVGERGDGVGHALARADGDVIVAGDRSQKSEPDTRDIWVARFDGGDGSLRWEYAYAGAVKRNDTARAVAVGPDGRVVVAGSSQESDATRLDVWVGWLDPVTGESTHHHNLGTSVWEGGAGPLDESARALAIAPSGELLIGGTRCVHDPCVVPDAWVGRFTAEGKALWTDPMLWVASGAIQALAPAGDEFIAAGGDGYEGAPGRSLLRRFADDGAGTWSGVPEAAQDVGYVIVEVAVAGDGRLWVVGRETPEDANTDGFVRIYDPADDVAPVAERRGDELGGDATCVALAADGRAVVGGGAGGRLWFGAFADDLSPAWRVEVEDASAARGLAVEDGGVVVLGVVDGGRPVDDRLWLRRYAVGE